MRAFMLLILVSTLGGCAATVPGEVRSGEIYQRHASEETVNSVLYGSIRSWRPAGDDAVLIEFNRNRHYLFELDAACRNEVRFANRLRLISSTRQRVDRFDRIHIGESACRILAIREVDFEAVQEDLRALRQDPEPAREAIEADLTNQDE